MSVLVVYGSKRGGTQGLAEMVATALRDEGFTVDVHPANRAPRVGDHDGVVVGGSLYAMRWHRDARRFVKRNRAELRAVPTYFFASGPLDDSAAHKDIPPVSEVRRLMQSVGATVHATFGGRLLPDAKGFPASTMAKKHAGDWRDVDHVRRWVSGVAAELRAASSHVAPRR